MSATRKTGLRPAMSKSLMRLSVRTLVKPMLRGVTPISLQRQWLNLVSRVTLLPKDIRCEEVGPENVRTGSRHSGSRHSGSRHSKSRRFDAVRGEWVRSPDTSQGAVLYLHGGAFVVGGPQTHRGLTAHLARETKRAVFVLDYPLAPEASFPQPLQTAVLAYQWLQEQGYRAGQIVLMGDSAGGGLALSTALKLRDLNLELPAALVLLSPWTDLTLSRLFPAEREALLREDWLRMAARRYLQEVAPTDPLASPLYARLENLPPMLIQVSSDEILLNDSKRLAQAVLAADGKVELQEHLGLWHVFQLHAGLLAESDQAVRAIAKFLNRPC